MAFVSDTTVRRVHNLRSATMLVLHAVEDEVRKPETTDRAAIFMGVLGHLSQQLQCLVEITSGAPDLGAAPTTTVAN